MPELLLGVDEFTLVLRPSGKIDAVDWQDALDKMIKEFIHLSHIKDIYGELRKTARKLQAGYTSGITVADRPWHFMICWHDDIPVMGLCIKYSAQAYAAYCKDYEQAYQVKMNVAEFLKMIQSDIYDMRLSRIDLVADYINYPSPCAPTTPLSPNTLYRKLTDGEYVIKNHSDRKIPRTLSAIDNGGAYVTFYVGSRKSKTDGFLRCYDKKLEQEETRGTRYDEAVKYKSWVRFEAVYRGNYAHKITEELQKISTEDELKQMIAKCISDRYQFYDIATGGALEITEDLVGVALGSQAGKLSCPGNRDNTLRQSIQHLKKHSGLFAIFYKIEAIWGQQGIWELNNHLVEVYWKEYKPEAGKKTELKSWYNKHYEGLKGQRIEDNFN